MVRNKKSLTLILLLIFFLLQVQDSLPESINLRLSKRAVPKAINLYRPEKRVLHVQFLRYVKQLLQLRILNLTLHILLLALKADNRPPLPPGRDGNVIRLAPFTLLLELDGHGSAK